MNITDQITWKDIQQTYPGTLAIIKSFRQIIWALHKNHKKTQKKFYK